MFRNRNITKEGQIAKVILICEQENISIGTVILP